MTVMIALVVIIAIGLLLEKVCDRIWKGKIRVRIWFNRKDVQMGQEFEINEVVINTSRMFFPYIYLKYDINRNGRAYRNRSGVFSLLYRQKVTRHIPYHMDERGRYDIGITYIVFKGLFLRSTLEHSLPQRSKIIVYPKLVDVSDIPVYTFLTEGNREHNPRLYEDRLAFRDIRQYTDTDPMSRINWSATARTDELMVNTYEDMRRANVRIVMELPDRFYEEADQLQETDISIAASIYVEMLKNRIPVSFISNARDAYTKRNVYLPERCDEAYEKEVLESFARIENSSDGGILTDSNGHSGGGVWVAEDISSRTTLIFISQMGDVAKGLKAQVLELAQRGHKVLWVVVSSKRDIFSVDEARQKICDLGIENNVEIYVWNQVIQ